MQLKERYELYIDGAWVKPTPRKYFGTTNPATGKQLAQVAQGSAADVCKAAMLRVHAALCALPPGDDVPLVLAALDAGIPVATSGDEHDGIATLLRLDGEARDRGLTVLAGCGLAPGLSDVLAAHAATLLDSVDEIHVARAGIAGAKSEASLRRVHSDRAIEVRGGEVEEVRRRTTHELVHFPDPVGAQECEMVGVGVDLLHDAFPGADRITVRAVEPPPRTKGLFTRDDPGGRWGATKVEVWGRVGNARVPVVYGAAGRTATVGGTVLAVAASAVQTVNGQPSVFVADAENRFHVQAVETGADLLLLDPL